MTVIVIIACAIVGTIMLLFLAGAARWSFIYLIYYRMFKHDVKNAHYESTRKKDILAIFISIITLICVAILLIYGVPYVVEHFQELKL